MSVHILWSAYVSLQPPASRGFGNMVNTTRLWQKALIAVTFWHIQKWECPWHLLWLRQPLHCLPTTSVPRGHWQQRASPTYIYQIGHKTGKTQHGGMEGNMLKSNRQGLNYCKWQNHNRTPYLTYIPARTHTSLPNILQELSRENLPAQHTSW